MDPGYTIRAAQPGDVAAIVALCREHAAFEGADYAPEGKATRLTAHLFGDHPRVWCLVVDNGSQLVGYATYMLEYSTWDAAPFAYLDCLYLRPEARGAGLGRRMVGLVEAAARAAGCTEVQWQTPRWNADAIAFYERLGAVSFDKARFTLVCGRQERH